MEGEYPAPSNWNHNEHIGDHDYKREVSEDLPSDGGMITKGRQARDPDSWKELVETYSRSGRLTAVKEGE